MNDSPVQPSTPSLLSAIQDVKDYLLTIKNNKDYFPGISKTSEACLSRWTEIKLEQDTMTQGPFFSNGPEEADVYFLDSQSRFFSGDSGQLLIKILSAMNLSKDQVFICNCDDLLTLNNKLETNSPKVIITLGSKPSKALKNTNQPLDRYRGKLFDYLGIKVMPTYHPSLLLKAPEYKRQVWDDMQQVMRLVGLSRNA